LLTLTASLRFPPGTCVYSLSHWLRSLVRLYSLSRWRPLFRPTATVSFKCFVLFHFLLPLSRRFLILAMAHGSSHDSQNWLLFSCHANCYKHGGISFADPEAHIPEPSPLLHERFISLSLEANPFRKRLQQINSALSYASVGCRSDNCTPLLS
jgi:hypothetical protein